MLAAAVEEAYTREPYMSRTWRPWHDAIASLLDSHAASDVAPLRIKVVHEMREYEGWGNRSDGLMYEEDQMFLMIHGYCILLEPSFHQCCKAEAFDRSLPVFEEEDEDGKQAMRIGDSKVLEIGEPLLAWLRDVTQSESQMSN